MIIFFVLFYDFLSSCQENSIQETFILDNTKIEVEKNITLNYPHEVKYNGWDTSQCIRGKSIFSEDYYRIVFCIFPKEGKHSKDYIYEYATKKCYDVSRYFTSCNFYIDFEWDIEYYKGKKIFYKLPDKYFKLIDSFVHLGNRIYFISRDKQKQIGLRVRFMNKKEWDYLVHIGLMNKIKFLDDL